jgi:hypothetical protein
MKWWIIAVVAFLVIGGFLIVNAFHYNLGEPEGRSAFFKDYGTWMGQLFKNVRGITAYATSVDWMPSTK